MSSWDTNSWSNFCDPHWELVCRNKWLPGNSCRDTLPCATWHWNYHGIFRYFQVWSSLLSGGTVQPKNTYSCILKKTGQVWESQKRISINTNYTYHKHSSPYAGLNWSDNKIRFSFNQPNRKRSGAKLVDVIKHLPHKVCRGMRGSI